VRRVRNKVCVGAAFQFSATLATAGGGKGVRTGSGLSLASMPLSERMRGEKG
jgi:hypothetical protein